MTNRVDPRLDALAEAALDHAINGQCDDAWRAVRTIAGQFGVDGIIGAMMAWTDTLIVRHAGRDGPIGQPARPVFVVAEAGAFRSANEVPSPTTWAELLLAARFAGDVDTFVTLIDSCTDETRPDRVRELLAMVASAFRTLLRLGPIS